MFSIRFFGGFRLLIDDNDAALKQAERERELDDFGSIANAAN